MSIPKPEELKAPVLKIFEDGKNHRVAEIMRPLADQFGLTDEDRAELLPSGQETRWHNRVSWALYDLYGASVGVRSRIVARRRIALRTRNQC